MTRWCRFVMSMLTTIGIIFFGSVVAHADPLTNVELGPFPDDSLVRTWYTEMQPADYFLADQPGVWFLSPTGLNCGIWAWGSFGCTGDIPGLPPGENHIAWYNGNRAVHHGWTAAIQFPPGRAERQLPPRSFVTYATPGSGETTCAVTPEGDTYCAHGEFKFLTTPAGTWFKGWDDRTSYVCNSYGTCPPG